MELVNVEIREATISDIPECAAMIAAHEAGDVKYWQERFEADLGNPRRSFLVASFNDQVIGYGHTVRHDQVILDEEAGPDGYFLSGLLVTPDLRRGGVGSKLTGARIDRLRERTDMIYYYADPENEATISMHARLGFKEFRSMTRFGKPFTLFRLDLR
ncbi:MAG: GNAT family N-acetyltransferase [Acidobacteria bacterium]|nr:GNAT family N-acetyltransferase [Acidobacteriota bacterium]